MITDALTRVSEDQAISATAVSAYSIDLSQQSGIGLDVGEGTPLYMVVTVTQTFDTLTSLDIAIVTDTASTLGSATTLATKNVTLASGGLADNQQHVLQVPPAIGGLGKRYLGASYTVNGSTGGAGKVTTDFVTNIQDGKKYYASGFTA